MAENLGAGGGRRFYRTYLEGRPVPFQRTTAIAGSSGKVARVNTADYRRWKNTITAQFRDELRRHGPEPFFDPGRPLEARVIVGVDLVEVFFVEALPSTYRPRGVRGDIDNYAKAVLDAAQGWPRKGVHGGVMKDDRQIVRLEAVFAEDLELGVKGVHS